MNAAAGFERRETAGRLARLAELGVSIGTSSWKYPGWLGLVYDEARYLHAGKFSRARFAERCLAEYAELFPTVCVDASYYRFPGREQVARLCAQVPGKFRFSFKVTEEITVARFPLLPRHRGRAGERNPNFLSAESFKRNFLRPVEPHAGQVGLLIFEFSRLKRGDFRRGREFIEQLDVFLGQLPTGWRYGVEIRNRSLLRAEYFDVLRSHGVAHVYNSWQKMSGIGEQAAMAASRTAGFFGARLLLQPGRSYASAVDAFSPYDRLHRQLPEVREAVAALIRSAVDRPSAISRSAPEVGLEEPCAGPSFVYVNNRLEGCSPLTVAGILDRLEASGR